MEHDLTHWGPWLYTDNVLSDVSASHSRLQYPTNINLSTSCSVFVSVFLDYLNSRKRLNYIAKVVKLGSFIAICENLVTEK